MADASGAFLVYNDGGLLVHPWPIWAENLGGDMMPMIPEIEETKPEPLSIAARVRALVGVGIYLLLLGIFLEGLTVVLQQWVSFPLSLALETQILLTVPCVVGCLAGVIWFNRTLQLIRVHFLDGKKELASSGPFAYVRHPLYSTLLLSIPPLFVVWLSDLLFLAPWVLLIFVAHILVRHEERGLMEAFGQDYQRYRRHVPALLPYKGRGGNRYGSEGS